MKLPSPADRLIKLFASLGLFGLSLTLLVGARLGLDPWDVLHQSFHIALGTIVILVSCVALLLWIPLRQRPGFGTFAYTVVVGIVVDLTLPSMARFAGSPAQVGCLCAPIELNALATALHLRAALGPGQRDGLMTALVSRCCEALGGTRSSATRRLPSAARPRQFAAPL
jgi:uncharacterized membrane protein YczE